MSESDLPNYELIALKYATRDARRPNNFVGGDPHDVSMPMDYFIWVIRNEDRLILVDTGFNEDMAIKRHRNLLRTPASALGLIGVLPSDIKQVIITHLHNDHVGTFDSFSQAKFHLQEEEMSVATGRHMRCEGFRRPFEIEHVAGMIRLAYKDQVVFHQGDAIIAPGVEVLRIGGHTAGMQAVRVHTRRGWVVLASDSSHYYEHFEKKRVFSLVFNLGEVMEGYEKLLDHATSAKHVIPGHDPLVIQRYPAYLPELEGIAVSLDKDPLLD
jgi:glyoxylase-like metal-dependent hydrolase (beta-lactamase superfamily II)